MAAGADRARLAPALAAALVAVAAIGLVGEFRSPLNGDAAYQLDAARRMLGGAGLYTDLIDLNPPFIFWLSLPVAALGLDGAGTIFTYRLCIIALAAAALFLAWPWVRGRPAAWAGFLLMALALPLGFFGEREHLLFITVFPLVSLFMARAEGREPGRAGAVAAGLLAALGILLKPMAVILLLVLAAYPVSRSRSFRPLLRPELVAAAAGGLLGLVAVLVFAPGYAALVGQFGALYAAFSRQPLTALLFRDIQMWLVWAAVAGVLIGGRALPAHPRVRMLAGASVALFAAAVSQGKGFGYHYFPAAAFAILTLLELAVSSRAVPGARPLIARLIAVAAIAPAFWLFGAVAWSRAQGRTTPLAAEQQVVASLIDAEPGEPTVGILSARIADAYPVVLRRDFRYVLSFPHAWMATLPTGTPAAVSLRRRYGEDLASEQPEVLVVRATAVPGPGDADVDYIAYLCADPVAREALRSYTLTRQVEGFDLYRRTAAGAGPCASS